MKTIGFLMKNNHFEEKSRGGFLGVKGVKGVKKQNGSPTDLFEQTILELIHLQRLYSWVDFMHRKSVNGLQ